MRTVPEWIAKHDDERIPDRVRVRIFETYNGVCQCGCARKIRVGMKWQCDHVVALVNGGQHREVNLVPLLVDCHKSKTARDVAIKSKSYRIRRREAGVRRPRTIRAWRRFNGDVVYAPRERT